MLNTFDIPKPQNGFVSVFPGYAGNTSQWLTWEKPAGIVMIRFVCIGGGAGGTSGFPSATTTARGGGGGGGSGGFTTVEIPATLLPDILYVCPGGGGRGGASSTSAAFQGLPATGSFVSIAPSTSNIYLICAANGGSVGNLPTASAGGTGGGGGGISNIADRNISGLGIASAFAGAAGATGGFATTGNGNSITYPVTGLLLSGGAGGGGNATGNGGNITAPASQSAVLNLFQTLNGGTAGATAGNGSPGVALNTPLLSTGGSGGGCNSGNALGGFGGDGAFGSGGGGGGAGGTTGGGGAGGNGGPGLVMIYSW
jgi:hypothetical protein